MFKSFANYFQKRKERKIKEAALKKERIEAHEVWIKKSMEDGTLWKGYKYPVGHPGYIATID